MEAYDSGNEEVRKSITDNPKKFLKSLGTTILSAVIMEHLSDVNRMVCCAVQQTRDSL